MKKFFQDKVLVAGFSVVLVTVLLLGGSWMLADEEKPLTLVQEVKHLREQVKEANRLREAKETELASEAEGSAKYRQEAVQLRSELAGMQARMKTAEARAAGWESARQLAAGDAVKAYQAEMEKLKADLIIAQAEKAAAVEQYKRAAGESAALQTHMDEWVKRQAFDPATTASVAALNELRAKLETSLKAREEADKEAGKAKAEKADADKEADKARAEIEKIRRDRDSWKESYDRSSEELHKVQEELDRESKALQDKEQELKKEKKRSVDLIF